MNQRKVQFDSGGSTVTADLLLPEGGDKPYPVVIMAGGWCYVKELIQPRYAEFFVRAGFAVLLFDYRHLGESEGEPRQHLDPWQQIEDYRNALSFAEAHPDLDKERMGIWGISYSGGHVLIVGAMDPRVRCIVSNIPVVDGYENMRRVHGTLGFRRLEEAILEDRRERFATGTYGFIPMSSLESPDVLATWPFPEVFPVFDELRRSSAPNHDHRSTIASVDHLLAYNIFPYLERILNVPTLMVVADHDDLTLWDKEIEAFNAIPASRKELYVVGDTSHMTLYSDKSRLELAAEKAAGWFRTHLLQDGTDDRSGAGS